MDGKKTLLVDTDPGVDDCAALMMLMSQVPVVKIVGLTCAAGNVGIRDVSINAIPIFQGCSEPMVALPHAEDATFYHGKDGLGDVPDIYPERSEDLLNHVQSEHGVDAIIRLSKEYEGRLQIICLGALTNIAMAAKLDSKLPQRLKSLHILGGTIKGYGNSSPCAEYNFYTDPEAAYNVFRTFPQHCATEVIPYETALDHGISPVKFRKMTSGDGKKQRFYRQVFKTVEWYEDRSLAAGISTGYCICDAYATAIVLNPDVIKKYKEARVTIELSGHVARGSFVIDHKNKGSPHLSEANVKIIQEIDDSLYEDLLEKAFKD